MTLALAQPARLIGPMLARGRDGFDIVLAIGTELTALRPEAAEALALELNQFAKLARKPGSCG